MVKLNFSVFIFGLKFVGVYAYGYMLLQQIARVVKSNTSKNAEEGRRCKEHI